MRCRSRPRPDPGVRTNSIGWGACTGSGLHGLRATLGAMVATTISVMLLALARAVSADSVCPAGAGGPCVFSSSTHSGGDQDCSHATSPYSETHGVAATTGNAVATTGLSSG